MRRTFLYGLMTALLVAGATTAPRAQGGKQTLVAILSGGSEAPGVVNTGAYGKATITIDPSAGEVTWVIDVFNFPTGLTASHIHAGAAGTAGPIIIDFQPGIIGVSGPFQLSGSTKNFIARPAAGALTVLWLIAGYALFFGVILVMLAFRARSFGHELAGHPS
jgi:hypothetical protein